LILLRVISARTVREAVPDRPVAFTTQIGLPVVVLILGLEFSSYRRICPPRVL